MFIGTTQNVTKINNLTAVKVDGKLVKRAKKVKYLGLVIDENMKWDEHIYPTGFTSLISHKKLETILG